MPELAPRYSANDLAKDGPFTAPRKWHHVLKVLISVAIYTLCRDLGHLTTGEAALVASPVLIILVSIKQWNWPSDPNEHTYTKELRIEDFLTDFSCTLAVVVLWLCSGQHWWTALGVALVALLTYFTQRHGARP